jgi:hypothetical protein
VSAGPLIDDYISAFRSRSAAMAGPDDEVIEADGVVGTIDRGRPATGGRLLVLDDRAVPTLRELAPDLPVRVVIVPVGASESRRIRRVRGGLAGDDLLRPPGLAARAGRRG